MSERAIVRDERASTLTWFVYIEGEGGAIFAGRFKWQSSAERVAAVINRELEREGRA